MRTVSVRGVVTILALLAAALPLAIAQDDAPSLGDVARQARQQKQKDAQPEKSTQAPAKDSQSKAVPDKATPNPAAAGKTAPAKDQAAPAIAKDTATVKPAKRVITNDEIPEHLGPTSTLHNPSLPDGTDPQPTSGSEGAAEQWKAQIQSIKNYIANLQTQISDLEQSIHYAGANCVSGCVQWNERQQQKQEQVNVMKQQLEDGQKRLEEMQDNARRQGFGSTVYDP